MDEFPTLLSGLMTRSKGQILLSIFCNCLLESFDAFLRHAKALGFDDFGENRQNWIKELLATHARPPFQSTLEETNEPEVTRGKCQANMEDAMFR
jgi:hypothetical protein